MAAIRATPDLVQRIFPILPTYHLASLTHQVVGFGRDGVFVHGLALVVTLGVGATVTAVAYRRAASRQFA